MLIALTLRRLEDRFGALRRAMGKAKALKSGAPRFGARVKLNVPAEPVPRVPLACRRRPLVPGTRHYRCPEYGGSPGSTGPAGSTGVPFWALLRPTFLGLGTRRPATAARAAASHTRGQDDNAMACRQAGRQALVAAWCLAAWCLAAW